MKDLTESPAMSVFRAKFEAGRSFDLDDDMEYCPGLLDDDDVCDDLSLGSVTLVRVWMFLRQVC